MRGGIEECTYVYPVRSKSKLTLHSGLTVCEGVLEIDASEFKHFETQSLTRCCRTFSTKFPFSTRPFGNLKSW